uniref:Uncharacterized protein n=1 Tax=Octopus bimaculoides TaxID=37653 RepID=A0A0L8HIU1_OCTBM
MANQQMNPRDIRYSQDTIKSSFQNGEPLLNAIHDIKVGKKSPNDFPSIDVYEKDGKYYSSDNRRLHVFKEVEKSQPNFKIPVSLKRGDFVPKLTTANDGSSVTFRDSNMK